MENTQKDPGIRAYLITLGLSRPGRGDIVVPLAADIESLAPERLTLICTSDTRETAERLSKALTSQEATAGIARDIHELPEAYDIDDAFQRVNELIQNLRDEHGIGPDEIAINYTSGTRVMSAGAILSGVFNEVEALRYLQAHSEGASTALSTNPSAVFVHREAALAMRLARELRFMSASDILSDCEKRDVSPEASANLQRLRRIFEGFGAWDSLRYESAIIAFRRAREIEVEDRPFNGREFEPTDEALERLDAIVESIDSHRFNVAVLADLINNAHRRLREDHANDAMIRAYRSLEMLAQYKLSAAHDIDTNKVDVRRIPPRNRDYFNTSRSPEDGRLRIGLRKSYELLQLLDDPLGKLYADNDDLRELVACRYKSLLAHGFRSLTMAEATAFVDEVSRLITSEFPDFDQECRVLRFPWFQDDQTAS